MKKTEILAPCGSAEALLSAVRCRADAVYFGLDNFNARKNAANFSGISQQEATRLCRLYGTKMYVTLNTLLKDSEFPAFQEALQAVCAMQADAVILQDLGAVRLLRSACPKLERHASTQLSVGTAAGLRLLKRMGFVRAVLPRELSKAEIQKLRAQSDLEFEVFVHGALCMCVSGQCLLSAMLGSRSGNRGLCAQPCRLPFAAENGTGHDLSLKDLSILENLAALSDLGVTSFKIEGRMKRPEYVAAAVTAARESLEGSYTAKRKADLEALFSRSGFTAGYYNARRGREMFGTRRKENVTAATQDLLKSYARLYEKPQAVRTVQFVFTAEPAKPAVLTTVCDGHEITVVSETPCAAAEHRAIDAENVSKQLKKCGGTVFTVGEITCHIQKNPSMPLSAINAMRRAALAGLEAALLHGEVLPVKPCALHSEPHEPHPVQRYIRIRDTAQIPEKLKFDKLFLPLFTESSLLQQYGAGVYLPRGIFGTEESIKAELQQKRPPYALCDTLDAAAICLECEIPVIGGPFLNLCNTPALEEAKDLGIQEAVLSFEVTLSQAAALGGSLPRGLCVYGRTPLMLTRNCPIQNGKTCTECGRQSVLTDRRHMQFPVRCENGYSEIFNAQPTYMADRLREIRNTDFQLFDFTVETKAEIQEILTAYDTQKKPTGDYTRGLYYRGVE